MGYASLIFDLDIPPSTIIFFLVNFDNNLNLFIPKKFLFFLNNDDKNIFSTFWSSLILISLRLWAEPIIWNFFFSEKLKWFKFLLNEGK